MTAVDRFAGDLMTVLLELETLYETQVRPMAEFARLHLPMVYRPDFEFRTPVYDATAAGSTALIEGQLCAGRTLVVVAAVPAQTPYNRDLYFGPTTRSTQTLTFETRRTRIARTPAVTVRTGRFAVFAVDLQHDPSMRELVATRGGHRFQVLCEQVTPDRAKLALAVSVRRRNNCGDDQVDIDWIDAADHLRLDRLRILCGADDAAQFPYTTSAPATCWRIVMGNGCRVDVCVTDGSTWTLTNADGDARFAECASLLRSYYRFQCCAACSCGDDDVADPVHPLSDDRAVVAFAVYAATRRRVANLDWLVEARLESQPPPPPPPPPANQHMSQLLQAIALKGVGFGVEYARFAYISTDDW